MSSQAIDQLRNLDDILDELRDRPYQPITNTKTLL